jgi:hypothetical protein
MLGVESAVAFLDAAGALVSGNGDADMVGASSLARGEDFLPRFAGRQSKDLIAEAGRRAIARGCSHASARALA